MSTIQDVANKANVSKASVSRVINNAGNVTEGMRSRVIQAMEELDYRPSAVAKNLATKTSNLIGLILPDITNPFFPVLARGIEDATHRLGYSVFLCNSDNDPQTEQDYVNKMIEQQVAGMILISSSLTEKSINQLSHFDLPIVLCDRLVEEVPYDLVAIDNYKAAYEVVTYLISKGHKRIYHLGGPEFIYSAKKRKQGYCAAMRDAGLSPLLNRGAFTYESGFERMTLVLKEESPTAVFAANDLLAFGAINAIEGKGMKVPDDMAVFGCDDILFSKMCKPALSTITIPAYQMGVTAMELLNERIKGVRTKRKKIESEYRLVIRESCGGRRTRT